MRKSVKKAALYCVSILVILSTGVTALAAASNDSSTEGADAKGSNSSASEKTKSNHGVHVSATRIASSVLGKTEDEIRAAVKSGTSLGQQLTDAGKLDHFKSAYLAEYKSKLDAAVAAGALTQAQADQKYASKQSEIDAWDGSEELSKHGRGHSGKEHDATGVSVIAVAATVLGKTEDEIKQSVKSDKVGTLLLEAGKLDAFKKAYLAESKSKLEAAVTAGTFTQQQADEKYAEEQTKMQSYDGTTHLCGGEDHSKMFEKKS